MSHGRKGQEKDEKKQEEVTAKRREEKVESSATKAATIDAKKTASPAKPEANNGKSDKTGNSTSEKIAEGNDKTASKSKDVDKPKKVETPNGKSIFNMDIESFDNLHKKLLDEGFVVSHSENNKKDGFIIQASRVQDKEEESYSKDVKIGKNSYSCTECYLKSSRK